MPANALLLLENADPDPKEGVCAKDDVIEDLPLVAVAPDVATPSN